MAASSLDEDELPNDVPFRAGFFDKGLSPEISAIFSVKSKTFGETKIQYSQHWV